MVVLSLFDGISSGQLALERAGIKVEKYFASEIDKNAIKVAQHNYPNTIQLGDVINIKGSKLPKIDLLIGGSPCQGFSFLGGLVSTQLYFKDPRSRLFFEFVRLLTECKPKHFLLENVRMKKEFKNIISEYLGVEPIEINSALVSAQNRKRLYWTNIPNIDLPLDKNIMLKDIIEDQTDYKPLGKNWYKYVPETMPDFVDPYNKKQIVNKSTTLRTNIGNGNMWIKVNNEYRNLNRNECEKLQTVPVNYTQTISETQAKKLLGNGWTIDVIKHLFEKLNKE